ncbi:hypothetical protein C8R44DRAFT_731135 [Mycena epipterygia]|nr:hypothetical protein C8R44DRAFT_731135 [Mycena epipterygia]
MGIGPEIEIPEILAVAPGRYCCMALIENDVDVKCQISSVPLVLPHRQSSSSSSVPTLGMTQTHNGDVDELIKSKETLFGVTFAFSEYPMDFAPTRDMTLKGGSYYSYKSLALVNPYPRLSGKQYAPKFRAVVFGQVVGQELTPAKTTQTVLAAGNNGVDEIIVSFKSSVLRWTQTGFLPELSNIAVKVVLTRLDTPSGGLSDSRIRTTKETCTRTYKLLGTDVFGKGFTDDAN